EFALGDRQVQVFDDQGFPVIAFLDVFKRNECGVSAGACIHLSGLPVFSYESSIPAEQTKAEATRDFNPLFGAGLGRGHCAEPCVEKGRKAALTDRNATRVPPTCTASQPPVM